MNFSLDGCEYFTQELMLCTDAISLRNQRTTHEQILSELLRANIVNFILQHNETTFHSVEEV
jgi:hypothetical protein